MDEMVAWLRGVLDEMERVARSAVRDDEPDDDIALAVDYYSHEAEDMRSVVGFSSRAVLARVEAERAVVDANEDDFLDAHTAPDGWNAWSVANGQAVKALAHGHRYDAQGYRAEWAPAATVAP